MEQQTTQSAPPAARPSRSSSTSPSRRVRQLYPQKPTRTHLWLARILLLLPLVLFASTFAIMMGVFTPQKATILITPQSSHLAQTTSFLATLHPSGTTEIQATKISVTEGPVATKAQASGNQPQEARAATGVITYFNIATFTQAVPAGIILTADNGAQFRTDAPASVPGGNPPALGSATVPAHALTTGPQGNISDRKSVV